ncbi:hypothetical protein [Crossiella cryophila]|uniref:Secreted protein n=1 Tax=Crossiella cryophila TaxID=43355 RepID=A0A7W7FYN2_9PSEU|nr:hypothetical protein [Crossiella cryophila]MBB4681833.1 hypothetical protein [Crossiella cryophila]
MVAGSALVGAGPTALAEDTPPPIVEDFAYPDADKIFQEKGLRLYRGDGNIILVDCAVGGDPVRVKSRNRDEFCFKVLGPKGKLTMELDQTYAIRGNTAHNVTALVWVNGASKTVTVPKREWIGVGEGSEPGKLGVLLEINASA